MIVKGNQNIFDFVLQAFGTLENLFDDVLVPNSLNTDGEIQSNQEININAIGKGDDDIKMKISEQGLSMTNGEIPIIIEYRNGIVTDAEFGETATFDFEAKINKNTEVVFTINWGAEVGTTVINSTLVNGVWKALQTSILIPEGVDPNQTIVVTDNFGGIFEVGYTVVQPDISITLDMSTPSVAGFNLTFASGNLFMDWDDGGGLIPFVSGVELLKTYVTPGTKNIKISGDLINIVIFLADNSKITGIANLKTGVSQFDLSNNLISGILNMATVLIKEILIVSNNTALTGINHAVSGNLITQIYRIDNTGINGTHDLSNNPIEGQLFGFNCPALTGFTFAPSGNGMLTDTRLSNSGFIIVDLSGINISGRLWADSMASATSLILASSGNGLLNDVRLFNSGYTALDFSNTPCGGFWWVNGCSSLASMDFSNPGNTALTFWLFNNCNQTNFDFSVFPTSDGINMDLRSNSFTATEHDNQLINLDNQGWINGTLQIITGNTARTAASDAAHANLLVNGWTIT